MSFLDGAKLICLDENGERGEVFLAKGRKFSFGYYMACDHVLNDSNAKGLHCEINCDAFGRVTIHNMSEDYPVRVNDCEIKIKRPLLSGSKVTILGKNYLWEFPKGTSSECEDINADILSTPQKHVGIPEQPPNSCPELQFHRDVQRRFTVHNFGYCIESGDEGNSLVETDTIQTSELSPTSSNLILPILLPAMEETGSEERSVTPEPQINSAVINNPDETPKMDLINCTQNKENKSTDKNKKLLTFCHQSDIVITSFSPRETGFRNEKSFTAIYKPTTPRSVYSTPKSFLYESNVDDGSHGCIDFSTPATSKKAMKQTVTNSSMHLIDLTTPGKLRPASPQLKSSHKSVAKRNLIQTAAAKEKLQESGLALLETPNGDNVVKKLKTPDSVISVDSTDSSSVVEISEDSLTPSCITSAAPTAVLNKTPSKSIHSKTITTPKRTPHLLMKRAILTSAKKQGTTTGRTDTTPSTSKGTTVGAPIVFSPAGTANKQLIARRQRLSTPSKIANVSGKYMGTNYPKNIMISSESKRSSSQSSASRTLSTSTPLRSSAGLRTTAKTSPNLHKVRRIIGGAPLTSHISKIRKSLNLSPKGSPNDDASVSTATAGLIQRKFVCVPSPANARARAIASSICKDSPSTKKPPAEKAVLFSDKQINSEDSDNLSRTFTMVSDDDDFDADNSATSASKHDSSSTDEVGAPKIETDFSPVKPLIQKCSTAAISERHIPLKDIKNSQSENENKNEVPVTYTIQEPLTHITAIQQNVPQDAESVTQCPSADDRTKILETLEEAITSTILEENSYTKEEKSANLRQIADDQTKGIDDNKIEEDVNPSTNKCLTAEENSEINDLNKTFSPKKQNDIEAPNESQIVIIPLKEEKEWDVKSKVSNTVDGNKAAIENDDLLEEIEEVLSKSDELQKQLSVLDSPLEKDEMMKEDKNTEDDCQIELLSEELEGAESSEYGLALDSVQSSLSTKENIFIPIATTVSNEKLDKKSCGLFNKNEEIIKSVEVQGEIRESQLWPTHIKESSDDKSDTKNLTNALTPSKTSFQSSRGSSHHEMEDGELEPSSTVASQHKDGFDKNKQHDRVSLQNAESGEKSVEREKEEKYLLQAHSALHEKCVQQNPANIRGKKVLLTPKNQLECEETHFGISSLLQTPRGANEELLGSTSKNSNSKNSTHHLQNFTPRRSTRRASMSVSESCLTLTPKRITKRRASISVDNDVPIKTPKKIKTPLRKRSIFEETSEDMGAIVEEITSPLLNKTELKPKEIGRNKLDTSETKKIMDSNKDLVLTHQAELIEESICEVLQPAEEHFVIIGNENDSIINSVQVKLVDATEIDAEVEDDSICEIITASSKKDKCESKRALAAIEKEICGGEKPESKCEILDVSDYGYGKEVKEVNDNTSPANLLEGPQIIKKPLISRQPFDASKTSEDIRKQHEEKHEDSNELMKSSKIEIELQEDQPSTSADAKNKLNRMRLIPPQNCSTPHMLRKPKMSSTPCLEGIKELMDTSTADSTSQRSLGATLIERGLLPKPESLNAMRPEINETVDESLDRFLKTPRAKNIMVLTSPKSVNLKPSKDSVELMHSTEYDLNTTNFDSLDDMFKTPVPNRFEGYIDSLSENLADNSSSKSNDEKTQIISAEEAFDSLVGQSSIIQTPPRNIYSRKLTSTSSTIQQSPFSSTDIISDLPKTDIQEWVDSLEDVEVSEDQQDLEITLAQGEENEQSCDPLAASTIQGIESASIINDTAASENLINVSAEFSVVDPLAGSVRLTDGQNETSLCRLGAVDEAEISGIDILDQSVDSIFSQPLLVSESDSNLDKTFEEENPTKDAKDKNLEDEFQNFCDKPLIDVLGKCITPNHLERTFKSLRRSLGAQEDLNVTIDFETEREKLMQEKVSLLATEKKNQNLITEITEGVKEFQETNTEVKEETLETTEELKDLLEKTEEVKELSDTILDISSGTDADTEKHFICKESKDGINDSSKQLKEDLKKNESQTTQEDFESLTSMSEKRNSEVESDKSGSTEKKQQRGAFDEKLCDSKEETPPNIKNLTYLSENGNSESESVKFSDRAENNHQIDANNEKQSDSEDETLQNTAASERNLLKNKQDISCMEIARLSEDIQPETNDGSHFGPSEKNDLTKMYAYSTDNNEDDKFKERNFLSRKSAEVSEKSNIIQDAAASTTYLDKIQESKFLLQTVSDVEQIPLDSNKNSEENPDSSNPLNVDKSTEGDVKTSAKETKCVTSDNLEIILTSNNLGDIRLPPKILQAENLNCREITPESSTSKIYESDLILETNLASTDVVQTENETKKATGHQQLEEEMSIAKKVISHVALTKTSKSAEIYSNFEMESNQREETANNDDKVYNIEADNIEEVTDQEMTEALQIPETPAQTCITDDGGNKLLNLKEESKEKKEECDSNNKSIKRKSSQCSGRRPSDSQHSTQEEEKEPNCRIDVNRTQTNNGTEVESKEPKSNICLSSSSISMSLETIEKEKVSPTLRDSICVVGKADSTKKLTLEQTLQYKFEPLEDEIKQNKNVDLSANLVLEGMENKVLESTSTTKQVNVEKTTSVFEDIEKETSVAQKIIVENMKTKKEDQLSPKTHKKHDANEIIKKELHKRRGRKGSSSSQRSSHDEDETPELIACGSNKPATINEEEETNISERASTLDKSDILPAHNDDNQNEDLFGAESSSTNIPKKDEVGDDKSKIINVELSNKPKIDDAKNVSINELSEANLNQNQDDGEIVKEELQGYYKKTEENTIVCISKSDVEHQNEIDKKTDVVNTVVVIESGAAKLINDNQSQNTNELNQDPKHDITNRSDRKDVPKRRERKGSSNSQISSHDEDDQPRNIQTTYSEKPDFNNSQLETNKNLDDTLTTNIDEGTGSTSLRCDTVSRAATTTQKTSDDEGELTKETALESLTKPLENISEYPIEQNQEQKLGSSDQIAHIKNNDQIKAPELQIVLETNDVKNVQLQESSDRNECTTRLITDELRVNNEKSGEESVQKKNKYDVENNQAGGDGENVQDIGERQVKPIKEDENVAVDRQIEKQDDDQVEGVDKSGNKSKDAEEEIHILSKDTEKHFPSKGANRKELPKRRVRIGSTNSQNSSHDEDELPKRRAGRRNIQVTKSENEELDNYPVKPSPDQVAVLDNNNLNSIKTTTSKTITSGDETIDNECKIVSSDISNLIESLPPKTSYTNLDRIDEDDTTAVKDKHLSEEHINDDNGGDVGKTDELQVEEIKEDEVTGTGKTHSKLEKLEEPKLDLIEDPDTTKRTNRKILPKRSGRKGSTHSQYSSHDEEELPPRRAARRNIQATISEKEELNNPRNVSHHIKQHSKVVPLGDKETEVISCSSSSSTILKALECSKETNLESSSNAEVVNVEMKLDLDEMSTTPTKIALDYEISDGKCKLIGSEILKKQTIYAEENAPLKEYDSNREQSIDVAKPTTYEQKFANVESLELITMAKEADIGCNQGTETKSGLEKKTAVISFGEEKSKEQQDVHLTRRGGRRKKDMQSEPETIEDKIVKEKTEVEEEPVNEETDTIITVADQQNLADAPTCSTTAPEADINTHTEGTRLATSKYGRKATTTSAVLSHDESDLNQLERTDADLHATSDESEPLKTSRGRTRKPTARAQQFLEEERAKASTPKRKLLICSTNDSPTPQKMSARRGRKASTMENDVTASATLQQSDELVKKSRRGRKEVSEKPSEIRLALEHSTEESDTLHNEEGDIVKRHAKHELEESSQKLPTRRGRKASTNQHEDAASATPQNTVGKRKGRPRKVVTETTANTSLKSEICPEVSDLLKHKSTKKTHVEIEDDDDKPVIHLLKSPTKSLPSRSGRPASTREREEAASIDPQPTTLKRSGRGKKSPLTEAHSEGDEESNIGRNDENDDNPVSSLLVSSKLPARRGRKASTIESDQIVIAAPEPVSKRGGRGRRNVAETTSESHSDIEQSIDLTGPKESEKITKGTGRGRGKKNEREHEEDHKISHPTNSPAPQKLPARRGRKASTIDNEGIVSGTPQQHNRRGGRGRKAEDETSSEQLHSELEQNANVKLVESQDDENIQKSATPKKMTVQRGRKASTIDTETSIQQQPIRRAGRGRKAAAEATTSEQSQSQSELDHCKSEILDTPKDNETSKKTRGRVRKHSSSKTENSDKDDEEPVIKKSGAVEEKSASAKRTTGRRGRATTTAVNNAEEVIGANSDLEEANPKQTRGRRGADVTKLQKNNDIQQKREHRITSASTVEDHTDDENEEEKESEKPSTSTSKRSTASRKGQSEIASAVSDSPATKRSKRKQETEDTAGDVETPTKTRGATRTRKAVTFKSPCAAKGDDQQLNEAAKRVTRTTRKK